MKNSVVRKMMQYQAGGQDSAVGTGQGAGCILMLHLCWAYWSKRCSPKYTASLPQPKRSAGLPVAYKTGLTPSAIWQHCNRDPLVTKLLHLKCLLGWLGGGHSSRIQVVPNVVQRQIVVKMKREEKNVCGYKWERKRAYKKSLTSGKSIQDGDKNSTSISQGNAWEGKGV